jgi:hypothetical protein
MPDRGGRAVGLGDVSLAELNGIRVEGREEGTLVVCREICLDLKGEGARSTLSLPPFHSRCKIEDGSYV